jgi:hypothetical protein
MCSDLKTTTRANGPIQRHTNIKTIYSSSINKSNNNSEEQKKKELEIIKVVGTENQ